MSNQDALKPIVSLCKRRGFVYPGSEIYGGLANTWDYGPYGTALKRHVKQAWWHAFVTAQPNVVGLDSSILLNPAVWDASGHTQSFSDPLMECKACHARFRGDHLLEEKLGDNAAAGLSFSAIHEAIEKHEIACPRCGAKTFTEPKAFNLMFKTHMGILEGSGPEVYLRPETAQGIFLNFKHIAETCRKRVPFGIGQIGKSFRNEITPGNFIFRTREFEQMEMEFFCHPDEALTWYKHWQSFCLDWLQKIGLSAQHVRMRDHDASELSHYSNATCDVEYQFPFGWGELWGIASRGDFDLSAHQTHSRQDLRYTDPHTKARYLPHVIEPALGVDRLCLALLCDAYEEETLPSGDVRTVLRFHPSIAPIKAAILPLSKKPELSTLAHDLYTTLIQQWSCEYDETQSIGKRYRRQDELGTPFCITVDFDSLTDQAVTIRARDSMAQTRVPMTEVSDFLAKKIDRFGG